eukprot:GHVP01030617.1.p1 GENE.GHVP01030617.1~~GHVP01030617.1.p1  ORF type:complete len:383 (+),score=49.54 GHVP01030617.1:27-1151(+)
MSGKLAHPGLVSVVKDSQNLTCADCRARGPRWASVNLGVLVCLDCCGVHRSLGTHISQMRSVSLDSWKDVWVANIQKIGNDVGNMYYENQMPADFKRPNHSLNRSVMDSFIRKKYENKTWAMPGVPEPYILVQQGLLPKEVYTKKPTENREEKKMVKKKSSSSKESKSTRRKDLDKQLSTLLPTLESKNATDGQKVSSNSVPFDVDFMSEVQIPGHAATPISSQEIDMGPPTQEVLEDTKIAAAKESIMRLYETPELMGFSAPSYPTIIPEQLSGVGVIPLSSKAEQAGFLEPSTPSDNFRDKGLHRIIATSPLQGDNMTTFSKHMEDAQASLFTQHFQSQVPQESALTRESERTTSGNSQAEDAFRHLDPFKN